MRERDGRTPEQIQAHIEWTQADPFWRSNVLSMGAVRKHWDKHTLRMQQEQAPRASPPTEPAGFAALRDYFGERSVGS